MTNESKIALSIDEASQYTSIGKTRLYQAIGQGHLVAKKWVEKPLFCAQI